MAGGSRKTSRIVCANNFLSRFFTVSSIRDGTGRDGTGLTCLAGKYLKTGTGRNGQMTTQYVDETGRDSGCTTFQRNGTVNFNFK